jgi:hypothetical protein
MTKPICALTLFTSIGAALAIHILRADDNNGQIPFLEGRLVAIGIPGVSAVAPVGTFPPGGPIPTKFAAYTQPGKILDPRRILVGSTSNFGETLSDPNQRRKSSLCRVDGAPRVTPSMVRIWHLPGSFLSIDPTGASPLVIPLAFAAAGGQASTLSGFVQMYSAQNPAFLDSIHNPLAATANFTGVSNPLGLSLNNAFGRIWPANAPYGLTGNGSSTIVDPSGESLAAEPGLNRRCVLRQSNEPQPASNPRRIEHRRDGDGIARPFARWFS